MADLNFACSHCNQTIACDELWSGHEIQCPTCHGTLMVPAAQAPAAPQPAPGRTRLAANAQTPAQTGNRNIPIRNLAAPPPKKKNPLVGVLYGTIVIAALGAGVYYGYNWYTGRQEQQAQAADQGSTKPAPAPATDPAGGGAAPGATESVTPASPTPPKPPVWTLEVAKAKIPEGIVNGAVSGTNFVAEAARVDPVGAAHVLRFFQGQMTSPDREVLVYLYLKPGEKIGGQSLTISNQMKGASVPQVAKRWRVGNQPAPSLKTFNNGYAMKLELGQAGEDSTLPGKIFLALPDPEKTVVAGVFKATVAQVDPNAQAAQIQPQVPVAPTQPSGVGNPAFDRRYGTGRR